MAETRENLDIELIKKRTISGVVTFTLRTFFVQVFTFFSTLILTILLDPSVFGIFFVVSAILNLFIYFSDVGLAAALIQKQKNPTESDLKTTFTIQQTIVITLVFIGLILSSKIAGFYQLDESGLLLLRVLIFSLLLSSLKTIPSIILERQLNFTKLVIPQIAEHLVFYTLAVLLAYKGFALSSFTYAVMARGVVGLILIYAISPWMPGISFSRQSAKRLVSFGIPFQLNSILALLKDDLLTVFLGKILTFTQVGYIGWAQKFSFVPLRFFMDNVIKVTFPAYSRLQDNRKQLANAINKSLFFVTFFVYPIVFGMFALAPMFIEVIPRYSKWEPAIPLMYFFGINALFAAVNTTLSNTLFAIGKPKIILTLMIAWTTLTWALTYFLVIQLGYIGVAVASAIVAASTSAVAYWVKREIPISIISNIWLPFSVSVVMFVVLKLAASQVSSNLATFFLLTLLGGVLYLTVSILVHGPKLISDAKTIISSLLARG